MYQPMKEQVKKIVKVQFNAISCKIKIVSKCHLSNEYAIF